MAGGKSSKSTQEITLPEELQLGAAKALSSGFDAASLDYSPNRGVTTAGFAPAQMDAFANTNQSANAFGMQGSGVGSYLPTTETSANGIQGYSSGALYDANVDASMDQGTQDKMSDIKDGYTDASNQINGGGSSTGVFGGAVSPKKKKKKSGGK